MISLFLVYSLAFPLAAMPCTCLLLFGKSKKDSLPKPPRPKSDDVPTPPSPGNQPGLPEPPKPREDYTTVPKPPVVSGLPDPPRPHSSEGNYDKGPVIHLPDPKFFPIDDEDEMKPAFKVPTPRTPSDPEKRNAVMKVVRQLESALDRIHSEDIAESERKWYGKVKMEIENIKRAVDEGDAEKARRCLGSAELYIKMLELNASGR